MMPIAQFPGNRNWGYDGVFPFAVQNSYGGPWGLKKLVNACHQKGIAVFLDVVFNHLGPEGNYLEQFGPYFTDKYKTPWGNAINFDGQYSDAVRDFFSDNAIYWFEYFHIDGLRFDAIHEVHDAGAKHFWQFMHQNIRKLEQRLGRSFYTIAESDLNDPKVVGSAELGGFDFSAQWLDDFHHALYTLVDRERGKILYADFGNINQLAKAYKDGFVHSGEYVDFRKKKFGASSAGVPGNKFVVFIDNHDQAGNRSTGDCLSSLISFEKLKLAAAACLLSPYIPLLFMGEEYADEAPFLYFISHGDKELIESVRQGRKKTFEHFDWEKESPDPYDEKTFNRSKLQWEKIGEKKHNTIHRWYKQLILLRKTQAALQSFDKNDVWVNTTDDLFQLYRRSASGKKIFICLFNFSETASVSFTLPSSEFNWNKILDSNDEQWLLNISECESLPVFIQPEKKVIIPRLTVVVYGN
jgi:maltooligosyltrehalose trehalohydrolase